MSELALDPLVHRSPGYYNAFAKLALGREFGNSDLTYVCAPMYVKRNACRTNCPIPIMRPTDCVSKHFAGHQDAVEGDALATPLVLPATEAPWTPQELDHEVVRNSIANGIHISRVRRVGFFMDDVGFTKNESFHAFYLNDVSTGQLWLIAIVRKAEFCDCGCRGFCTYWAIHDAILSDLEAGAVAIWPRAEYDSSAFPLGSFRANRAGKPMPVAIAVTQLRADLPGYTAPVGLRASSHKNSPCPNCNIKHCDLGNLNSVSLDGGEWDHFTHDQYLAEVTQCTIEIQINTADDVRAILNSPLEYDRRKKNSTLGRRLVHDVTLHSGGSVQHLRAGDRLHPSRVLRDVADFEYTALPFVCTFWRCDPKTYRLLHVSPHDAHPRGWNAHLVCRHLSRLAFGKPVSAHRKNLLVLSSE